MNVKYNDYGDSLFVRTTCLVRIEIKGYIYSGCEIKPDIDRAKTFPVLSGRMVKGDEYDGRKNNGKLYHYVKCV